MIIWGGNGAVDVLNTGGRYNPSIDNWTSTTITNAPEARLGHTAVWTGNEMIIWGGCFFDDVFGNQYLNNGGKYNSTSDSWTGISTTNAPDGRTSHTAVWTGSEMIIWGGYGIGPSLNTGGRYNPNTDSWAGMSTANAPDGRTNHTAVWTSNEVIVWGGYDAIGTLNTGGKYNPGTDSWVATITTNAPDARASHTAIWSGTEMIVWGGVDGFSYLSTGGRYNPSTDSWTNTSIAGAPTARNYDTAVWTGSAMIIWGGMMGPIQTQEPGTTQLLMIGHSSRLPMLRVAEPATQQCRAEVR
jgi:N-acetylneuraminic acid mutarotase